MPSVHEQYGELSHFNTGVEANRALDCAKLRHHRAGGLENPTT
jgi:hypothetical protein